MTVIKNNSFEGINIKQILLRENLYCFNHKKWKIGVYI